MAVTYGPRCQQITLDTASENITTAWTKLEVPVGEGPAGDLKLGAQAIGFRCLSSATGAVATIKCAFVRTDGTGVGAGVQEVWVGTVTVSARRQGLANAAAGGYVCDIVWDKSQTYYVDAAGLGGCGAASPGDPLVPYVGMTAAGGLGTLRLEAWWTRNAG